jgi:hypothetical protein
MARRGAARSRSSSRSSVAGAVLLAAALAAGCASETWNVQHFLLAPAPYASRTAPEAIQVFRQGGAAPTRAHVEVAQISVREHGLHVPSTSQFSMDAAILEARRRASSLGADALKDVRVYVAPTGTVGAGSVSVDGVAIRWR